MTPDYIVCLEDGKKFKSLKRHLRTHYNLSPEEYREKWGLPHDYPMVAPNYAAARSELAKQMGLGTRARRSRREGWLGAAASRQKMPTTASAISATTSTSATTPKHLRDEMAGDGARGSCGSPVQVGCARMSWNLASSAVGFSAVRLPRASVQAESMAASLRS